MPQLWRETARLSASASSPEESCNVMRPASAIAESLRWSQLGTCECTVALDSWIADSFCFSKSGVGYLQFVESSKVFFRFSKGG